MRIAFLTDRPGSPDDQAPVFGLGPEAAPIRWGFLELTEDVASPEGWAWLPRPGRSDVRFTAAEEVIGTCLKHLARGPQAGLLVHVHGAGNPAPLSFARTGKLCTLYGGEDLELMGLVVSWSTGGFGVADYLAARRRLLTAPDALAGALAQLFQALALREPGSGDAFLLAHSLGNHLLGCVAGALWEDDPEALQPAFREVLLCAADVDDDALGPEGQLEQVERIGQEIHVYAYPNDGLPGLSFFGGFFIPGREGPALGNLGPRPRAASTPGGTPIDTVFWLPAAPPVTLPNEPDPVHHYWHTEPVMIGDLRAVLRAVSPKRMPWRSWNLFDRPSWTIRGRDPA
ncbi:MAG TPA: alpha/beta hydrolase [Roseomonas sp.]|jgi:hypothetical protein